MKVSLIVLFVILCQPLLAQPESAEQQASQYYAMGDWEKALPLYRSLFRNGQQLQFYDQYLNVLLKLKKYEEAELLIKTLLSREAENHIYQVDLGRVWQEKGEQQKADSWFKSLIRELPSNEYAVRDLAISFYRTNAYDYSVKTLLTGRKLLKDEAAFAFDLLSLYRFQKNKAMLATEYLEILGRQPDPAILSQAKNTMASMFDSPEDFDLLKAHLLRKAQKARSNPAYMDLLAWTYLQQRDYEAAIKQTALINHELKEDGERLYELGLMLLSERKYPYAEKTFEQVVSQGAGQQFYIPSKIQLLKIRHQMLTEGSNGSPDPARLEKDYQSLLDEFGKNTATVFAMRQLANLYAYYLNSPQKAELLLEEAIKLPQLPGPVRGDIKLELGDIYVLTGEPWEAALVYGQVEKEFAGEPRGQEAKFRNARLSYYQADFTWAKAQLDVLKSSTSQLIANDALNLSLLITENTSSQADTNALKKYAEAERLIFCNRLQPAVSLLDSIDVLYPGNSLSDDILMLKSSVYLKQNNVESAIRCLTTIVEHYSFDIWADDALFRLADLYETRLNDKEKAKSLYQKLITTFPGSLFVTEARKRFRNLRGDNLG